MIMLISLVDNLTKLRMGADCITFPDIGHRSGQYTFLMSQSIFFSFIFDCELLLWFIQLFIFLKWLCLLDK